MVRSRSYTRRGRQLGMLAVLQLSLAAASATASTDADAEAMAEPETSIAELSLEELMEIRLGGMAITGIHHTHDAGEWMTGYSYMFMDMDGNRDGTGGVSTGGVFAQGYMVAPTWMSMQMHMFHVMWAPAERLTLGLMLPYVRKSMKHRVNPAAPVPFAGTSFRTDSEGIGDLGLTALVSLLRSEEHRLIAEIGWSFPTGSIDARDDVPMAPAGDVRLPYPMQLGSGTFDARPGLTYIGQRDRWSWGVNARGVVRIGENDHHYALGDLWSVTGWGARSLSDWLSASLRLEGSGWGDIDGADPALNPAMVPTADPELRAGKRIDLLFGLNLFESDGTFAGNRIVLEAGLPVYQALDGPQLETSWRIQVGWEFTFDSPLSFSR